MFKGEATKGLCLASKCKRMEEKKSLQILKFGNPLEPLMLTVLTPKKKENEACKKCVTKPLHALSYIIAKSERETIKQKHGQPCSKHDMN